MAQGYGFLAVFVAALVLRMQERNHEYHSQLHNFAEELERLLMMALLVSFGGALATSGLLEGLRWESIAFGLLALLVVRPLSGWLSLTRSPLPIEMKAVVSFYGIRGVGSIYYLAYAVGHGSFVGSEIIWSTVSFVILASIILHGMTASPAMIWLDRLRSKRANDQDNSIEGL